MSKKYFNKIIKTSFIFLFSFVLIFNLSFAGTKTAGQTCTVQSSGSDCISGYTCMPSNLKNAGVGSSGVCTAISSLNNKGSQTSITDFSSLGSLITNFNKNIVSNLTILLSGVAVVVFLAGIVKFLYDRAKGNDKDLERDKKGILWGLGALFVLVTLWGIIKMVQGFLGVSSDNTINLPKICFDGSQNCSGSTSKDPAADVGTTGGVFGDRKDKIDTTTEDFDKEFTVEKVSAWPNQFAQGNKADYVAQLQNFLKTKMGYDLGTSGTNRDGIDGIYGQSTYNAVKLFQTQNKLASDGIVGPSTKAVILFRYLDATPVADLSDIKNIGDLSLGSRGDGVTILQRFLKANDCYSVGSNDDADGNFGASTKKAVINYQDINALKEDAIVGPSTRAVMMSKDTFGC